MISYAARTATNMMSAPSSPSVHFTGGVALPPAVQRSETTVAGLKEEKDALMNEIATTRTDLRAELRQRWTRLSITTWSSTVRVARNSNEGQAREAGGAAALCQHAARVGMELPCRGHGAGPAGILRVCVCVYADTWETRCSTTEEAGHGRGAHWGSLWLLPQSPHIFSKPQKSRKCRAPPDPPGGPFGCSPSLLTFFPSPKNPENAEHHQIPLGVPLVAPPVSSHFFQAPKIQKMQSTTRSPWGSLWLLPQSPHIFFKPQKSRKSEHHQIPLGVPLVAPPVSSHFFQAPKIQKMQSTTRSPWGEVGGKKIF